MIKIILSFLFTAIVVWGLFYMWSDLDKKGRKELVKSISKATIISVTALVLLAVIVYTF